MHKSTRITVLTILKRFEFDPRLLRSGVLALDSACHPKEIMFFVRGAPSSVRHLIPTRLLPPNYQQVWLLYTNTSVSRCVLYHSYISRPDFSVPQLYPNALLHVPDDKARCGQGVGNAKLESNEATTQ